MFWPKTIVNYEKRAKIWYNSVASVTLHLTCAFEVIKLTNESVNFHYNFYISLKSVKKLITPQFQDPLSRAFYK